MSPNFKSAKSNRLAAANAVGVASRWAYEDVAGLGITVIPEPATTTLMLGGLCVAALAARKRFRKQKATI